jgi:hypothetical protein
VLQKRQLRENDNVVRFGDEELDEPLDDVDDDEPLEHDEPWTRDLNKLGSELQSVRCVSFGAAGANVSERLNDFQKD